MPATREGALQLGLVTIQDMLTALVWSIEQTPAITGILDVPEIRRLGQAGKTK